MELLDDDLGGVEGDGDALAVALVAADALDVDGPLQAVDAGDLALTALVAATDDHDLVLSLASGLDVGLESALAHLVVLADGHGADLLNDLR